MKIGVRYPYSFIERPVGVDDMRSADEVLQTPASPEAPLASYWSDASTSSVTRERHPGPVRAA
ncbi:protein of unknown function [Pararobbsia alpina]